jgi:hypothetical protein
MIVQCVITVSVHQVASHIYYGKHFTSSVFKITYIDEMFTGNAGRFKSSRARFCELRTKLQCLQGKPNVEEVYIQLSFKQQILILNK